MANYFWQQKASTSFGLTFTVTNAARIQWSLHFKTTYSARKIKEFLKLEVQWSLS